ncbi:glucose-1-phosphate cytidylyltransferase [Methylobacterium sp. 285MFTsu5.1]|uniref:glucose-1-phosphate cytidylyltransferase n=1 Tax=Methylobacterium sp. 285MFTsu5.1 TaxID=1172187 RepID=UPI00039FA805|nr:glucose-1-phosphate cytidylyltransferase [Methylobacterium sp. 285MFTsu5.1]
MKVVLLAGGLGTRLAEETSIRPKPLVEIGGRPILWHIMKIFSSQGFNDFIICAGYKSYMIKEFFANYHLHNSNVLVDMRSGTVKFEGSTVEPWSVRVIDTGEGTLTGGRVKRIAEYLGDDDTFLMTYGDGVGDIDLAALVAHHKKQGTLATLTGAQPPGRFGQLGLNGDRVAAFQEKPKEGMGWINAGFFVLSRKVIDYIEGDHTTFEREPLEQLTEQNQLSIYRHNGFWLPMDSLRDKIVLEEMWNSGRPQWKTW